MACREGVPGADAWGMAATPRQAVPAARAFPGAAMPSFARFTPFTRGKIVGKAEEGVSAKRIRTSVLKQDGQPGSLRAINGVIGKARKDPGWQGENSAAGGRPPALSAADTNRLMQLIHDEVGIAKVTIRYCRKRLPSLKKVSEECVRRTLHRLGLAWRLRRGKAAVAKSHKPARLKYCDWALKQPQRMLDRWAYVDGTSWYLARTAEDHADKQRACLGKHCWRMATGEDGLDDKNVGASAYAKTQGQPIKHIWIPVRRPLGLLRPPLSADKGRQAWGPAHERHALQEVRAEELHSLAQEAVPARSGLHRQGLRAFLAPPGHSRSGAGGWVRSDHHVSEVLA